MEPAEPGGLKAAEAAAQRLRIDYAAADVLRAFDAGGIESIVLKGAPLVRWLYGPAERRGYADCDLLVPTAALAAAGQALTELGFTPEIHEHDMPEWWRDHGVDWFRAADGAAIDLHRTVPGARAEPERVWPALARHTQPTEIAAYPARSLDTVGMALQVALHAAQHGGLTRHVDELELALDRTDETTWLSVAQLASELDATAALATGLGFSSEGAAMAKRLGLPAADDVETRLRAAGLAEPITVERFARADTRGRIAMARHKLFPPPTFMRKWSPLARRGRVGLVLAYLWRPLWLVARLPRAIRGWRSGQRATDQP